MTWDLYCRPELVTPSKRMLTRCSISLVALCPFQEHAASKVAHISTYHCARHAHFDTGGFRQTATALPGGRVRAGVSNESLASVAGSFLAFCGWTALGGQQALRVALSRRHEYEKPLTWQTSLPMKTTAKSAPGRLSLNRFDVRASLVEQAD